jgi:hypothetical protein
VLRLPPSVGGCGTLADMAFILQRPGISLGLGFTDDDVYEFMPDGILKVTSGDRQTYYAPGAWEWVSTTSDHVQGPSRNLARQRHLG